MFEFVETQRFRQWWVWLIMIAATVVPVITILVSENWSERTSGIIDLIICVAIPPLMFGFFGSIKLTTRVNSTGVSYKFFPMQLKESTILWDDIEKVEIRTYKPIREYGGWGWRYSFQNGRAVNVSGSTGLQIVLKNGKKILIGTQKEEELRQVLKGLYKM